MKDGLGIYQPKVVPNPKLPACYLRRFVEPYQVAPAPDSSAGAEQGSVWRVGVDCGGILAEYVAVQQLLGRNASLEFVSDIIPRLKQYAQKHFNPRLWFNDVLRIKGVEKVPRVDIYFAGFPCQPFSTLGLQKGLEDPRGNIFLQCRD